MAETQEIRPPSTIPFQFFSKSENKTTQLADPEGDVVLDGAQRWFVFEFTEPVYLTQIEINSSGYERWDKFEVQVSHIDGTRHEEQLRVEEGSVKLGLGKLCSGFQFKPDRKWYGQVKINKVVAEGYTLSQFHDLEWAVKGLTAREAGVVEKETSLANAEDRLTTLQKERSILQSEVAKLTNQKVDLDGRLVSAQEQIQKSEALRKDAQKEVETLQEERRNIRSEIAADRNTLDELTNEIRLFPSEIKGFVDQGTQNIKTYLWIGLPFAAILAIILYSLFSNAIDLTQLWRLEDGVDVWTIFLTRIPFVVVAFALIEACGFIVGRLVFEIVKINRQRLEFAKLSIVAKDVTTAAASVAGLTEEERFAEETRMKMQLLSEHMKSVSSEEFKYQGTSISSAIIGLAGKMLTPKGD